MKEIKKCLHKYRFHKMVYPLKEKSGTNTIDELDMSKPEIESICAECGMYLKSVKVKKFII